MKPIRFILLSILFAVAISVCLPVGTAFAQAPQRFNYQAVARDASGNPVSEKTLSVRITVVEGSGGGTGLYTETFSPTTSKQGLFSIQVGGGTVTAGAFSSIVWGSTAKFLKVEIDPAGGSAFVLLGTSQLLSVPYAFSADRLVTPLSLKDLSDVSDTTPSVDQVLRWDGTSWTPGNGAGGIVTSSALSGDGSEGSPLTIAQQSASSGQVLQWNGTDWRPASISGGVGDNWGTQNVVGNATLSGAGTAGSPLGIASQGATNGQVLKFNGTAWTPANDAGDNWGTAKVNTSTQFGGDGTPVSPLLLAQQGATTGQFLKWSGISWVPGDGGGGGSLTLPASVTISDPGVALQIQNNTGNAILGLQNSSTDNTYAVKGRMVNSNGVGTAGVMGHHNGLASNGYGVFGRHEGTGTGVYGEVAGDGIGVSGKSMGSNGTGVSGFATGTAGKGIYGNANGEGYAGWFDEKVYISVNSSATKPTLQLNENENTDRARLRFTSNTVNQYWDISGGVTTANIGQDRMAITHYAYGEIMSVSGLGYVGIANTNPTQALDVIGNVKISNGIMAGGTTGLNGQVLQSTGAGIAWTSPVNVLYNNTYLFDQNADLNNISTPVTSLTTLPNLATSSMAFTITGPAKVIFTFSHSQLVSNGTGDVDLQVEMGFINSAAVIVNRAIVNDVILNNKKKSMSYTHHCFFASPGTYRAYIYVGTGNTGKFNAVGTGASTGQVSIQVIPQ